MEKKAQELYPNNKTFCGGVAQVAREAFIKGARLQKEADAGLIEIAYNDGITIGMTKQKEADTLHWQDIKLIVEIDHELLGVDADGLQSEEAYYTEILKRFNAR